MRVLLTGSAGFIGGAVATQLEAQGDEVVRVDLLIPEAHAPGTDAEDTHRVDVRDAGALRPLLDGVDVVCHQAAMVGAGATVADMPPPRRVTALDVGDFENHCALCDRRLDWALVDEDARLDPRSSYAASKVATEYYLAAWVRQAPGAAVALRYHNVYGPRMPRDTPYSGVAALFRSAIEQGRAPDVFEDGGQMRDFVHVDDVARANVLALRQVVEAEDESFATYNIASGEPIPIRRVAELVARGTGRDLTPHVSGRYRLGDVRHVVASPEKARRGLGFTAAVRPDDGLPAFAPAPLR